MPFPLLKTALVLFMLAFVTPFLGLPPLRLGWYGQVEIILAGLWLLGGLSGLWNYFFFKERPYLARKVWYMPVVWAWGPLIVLSLVISLFQAAPLQSWVGAPQLGDGIATFLTLLFLSPPFIVMTRVYRNLYKTVLIPLGAATLLALLTIPGSVTSPFPSLKNWIWSPIFFSDYIAYCIPPLIVLYGLYRSRLSTKVVYLYDIFLVALALLISYFADNKALFLGYALVVATYGALKLPVFVNIPVPKRLASILLLGFIGLTFGISFYDNLAPFLPSPLQNLASILSRTHLAKVAFLPYFNSPVNFEKILTFLFGHGWGTYNNTIISHMTLTSNFALFNGQEFNPTWEFIHRDLINSHNIFIEHFLALGFLGLALFCYLQFKIIQNLRFQAVFLGTAFLTILGTLLVFWFQLPHTYMFTTLGYCLLFSKTPPKSTFPFLKFVPLLSIISSFTLITFCVIQGVSAYKYSTVVGLRPTDNLYTKIDEFSKSPWLLYDQATGGSRTRQLARGLAHEIFAYLDKVEAADPQECLEKIRIITKTLTQNIPQGSNLTALVLAMNLYSELSTMPRMAPLFKKDQTTLKEWDQAADLVLQHLPYRSDTFVPYFTYLLTTGKMDRALTLCQKFLKYYPKDPIAYWFLGTIYLQDQFSHEKGLCSLRTSIQNGIQKFIPLSLQEVQKILEASAGLGCY